MYRLKPYTKSPKSIFKILYCTHPNPSPSIQNTHLDNVESRVSLLKSRSVVRFKGPDTLKFLQGLITNDIRNFDKSPLNYNDIMSPIYSALLTPQGRFMYDMFVYKPFSGPIFELLMDVDSSSVDGFLETFKKYRIRAKVEIENAAEEFSCWQCYGGDLSKISSQGYSNGWKWFKDPRLDCLGFRGIFPSCTAPPWVEANKEADEQNYFLFRLEKGVAEGVTEIPNGVVPHEYNLIGLNAISFNKGCYVGQELVARTHYKGVIRKRLIPLKFLDNTGNEVEANIRPESEVVDIASGKKVGKVTSAFKSRGFGVVRLDNAFKGSHTFTLQGQNDIIVEAVRPEWWPSNWFQES